MTEATTKTPLTEEQKQRRRAGRVLAFALFSANYQAENPGADKEARKAAWKTARKGHTKIAMKALRQLERKGFALSAPMPMEAAE